MQASLKRIRWNIELIGTVIAVIGPSRVFASEDSVKSNRAVRDQFDASDFYLVEGRPIKLWRTEGMIAARFDGGVTDNQTVHGLTTTGQPLDQWALREKVSIARLVIYTTGNGGSIPCTKGVADAFETVAQKVLADRQVDFVSPVFVNDESGLEQIVLDEIIVKFKGKPDMKLLAAADPAVAIVSTRLMLGTPDKLIVRLGETQGTRVLQIANRWCNLPFLDWAEPNFLLEVEKSAIPNDPMFVNQWHLHNTGQNGGRIDADVDAPEAWDLTPGCPRIIVAIIDDGVQWRDHPDLYLNVAFNRLETVGKDGEDDDRNGYIDDKQGWDFSGENPNGFPDESGDNDPSPSSPTPADQNDWEDNHGTSCAGVAVARGNNLVGVAGMAYGCSFLPVRVFYLREYRDRSGWMIAASAEWAIRYAGGQTATGTWGWRGADILSCSWHTSETAGINSALVDVSVNGRGGRGCPIFCAAGNYASGHAWYSIDVGDNNEFPPGTYRFRFEYCKDPAGSAGDDTAWLGEIWFPDGTLGQFAGPAFPAGWNPNLGDVPWRVVEDPGHAFVRHDPATPLVLGRYVARAGAIGNRQRSILESPPIVLPAGARAPLVVWVWVSSQIGTTPITYPPNQTDGDVLFVSAWHNVQGFKQRWIVDAGIPGNRRYKSGEGIDPLGQVAYPARHPATIAVGAGTDGDFRALYSQWGPALDFVAPSSGGRQGIWTTDRTGAAGYNPPPPNSVADPCADLAYTGLFGGTSSATPLAAGIAALMLSRNPTRTAIQIRDILRATCDKIGSIPYTPDPGGGFNDYYGWGRINANAALQATPLPTLQKYGLECEVGICCFPDGSCEDCAVTQWSCEIQGGTFACDECEEPKPCCLPNKTCTTMAPACCTQQGGTVRNSCLSCWCPDPCNPQCPGSDPCDPICGGECNRQCMWYQQCNPTCPDFDFCVCLDPCGPGCPIDPCNPLCGGNPCLCTPCDPMCPGSTSCECNPCGAACPGAMCNPVCGGNPCIPECGGAVCRPECGWDMCDPQCGGICNPLCRDYDPCDPACGGECRSCCFFDGGCFDGMDPVNCAELGGSVLAENLTCLGSQDGNGLDDGCESPKAVLGPPPVITMAVSRKMHGEAGTFDLDVCASIAIECRSHGPTQIVIIFDQPVQQTGGTVSDVSVSSGTVSTLAINDSQLTITMDGATDGQFLTIGFPGITGMTGQTANETLCFGVLNGDATGDKAVNIFDMLALKNIVNQPVTVDNYRMDITANGNINVLDLLAAKNNLYKTLNGSCP